MIDLYRFFIGFVGSVFVLLVFYRVVPLLKGKILYCSKIIGVNTLGIYIIPGFIFSYVLTRVAVDRFTVNYFITIIESIAILSISLICTNIIKKIPMLNRLLLGDRA